MSNRQDPIQYEGRPRSPYSISLIKKKRKKMKKKIHSLKMDFITNPVIYHNMNLTKKKELLLTENAMHIDTSGQ